VTTAVSTPRRPLSLPATPLDQVCLIVPTKDERQNLPGLLQTIPPEVELLLCDASTDGTGELALRIRPRNTRVILAPGTIAAARQLGAEQTARKLLVFSDADVTFAEDYFARLVVPGTWDAVCGAKLSLGDFKRYYRLVCTAQQLTFRLTGVATASGSNMVISRAAFTQLGGFRPELPCNEDTELFLRAQRLGLRVRFDPQLIVWAHDHRRLRRGLLVKSLHSLSRNLMIYATCRRRRLPDLLKHDWAYWSQPHPRKEQR
jgi:glycosyltransferase involved in cell wall biosynthesis